MASMRLTHGCTAGFFASTLFFGSVGFLATGFFTSVFFGSAFFGSVFSPVTLSLQARLWSELELEPVQAQPQARVRVQARAPEQVLAQGQARQAWPQASRPHRTTSRRIQVCFAPPLPALPSAQRP
jgi:hypothetical protein